MPLFAMIGENGPLLRARKVHEQSRHRTGNRIDSLRLAKGFCLNAHPGP
jgi:hypothetical protein